MLLFELVLNLQKDIVMKEQRLFFSLHRFTIGLFLRLQRAFFEVTILVHIWLEKEQIGSEHLQTESTFLPRFPTAMTLIINLV